MRLRHPVAGQIILGDYLKNAWNVEHGHRARGSVDSIVSVVGGHHGTLPTSKDIADAKSNPSALGVSDSCGDRWRAVQYELIRYALSLAGMSDEDFHHLSTVFLYVPVADLVTGLVIMTDWIASNQDLFPLEPLIPDDHPGDDVLVSLGDRARLAWDNLDLLPSWILVSRTDGSSDEVSLRDLLLDAGTIRSIDGDIPQQALPILRLALAVLYRAYCSEAEYDDDKYDLWERLWKSQRFESELINKYLMLWRGNFQLYGSDHPFMQVSGLTYADKDYDRIGEMIADVPKPDKCLFDLRDSRQLESISLDEAARWLVFFQAYDVAGIKTPVTGNKHVTSGKVYPPKGMVGTGFLGVLGGVFLEGENLFQTLLLNWVLVDKASDQVLLGNDDDLPSWERPMPPADLCVVDPTGPCELMTWQSRRVRLVLDEAGRRVVGQVSCYGDTTTANDNQRIEMMTSWRPSKAQQKKLSTSYLPCSLAWQSLSACLNCLTTYTMQFCRAFRRRLRNERPSATTLRPTAVLGGIVSFS